MISPARSPNQLAYYLATQNGNFNYAAAISVYLPVLGLMATALLVFRSKRFEIEQDRRSSPGSGPTRRRDSPVRCRACVCTPGERRIATAGRFPVSLTCG